MELLTFRLSNLCRLFGCWEARLCRCRYSRVSYRHIGHLLCLSLFLLVICKSLGVFGHGRLEVKPAWVQGIGAIKERGILSGPESDASGAERAVTTSLEPSR
jgi:hypothetical protein